MTTKKSVAKKTAPKVEKYVVCGDCDAKLPLGTEKCPKCGYGI